MTNKFNKVYSVSVEPDEFLSLNETRFIQTIQLTVGQLLMFDGMSMRDNWRELGPLFLNDFSNNVELLECNLKGEKWFAFNVVGFDKALSEEHSIRNIKNGKPSRIRKFKKMVFEKSAIENPELFRVREAGLRYFTTDAKNSLYSIVQEHGIKGLYFHEIKTV